MVKKISGSLGVVLAIVCLCGWYDSTAQSSGKYQVTGDVLGIPEGKVKLLLVNSENEKPVQVIDSARIINGRFTMDGQIGLPHLVAVTIQPGNWSFNFFLEDTSIHIVADTSGSRHFDYTAYGGEQGVYIRNYMIKGSKNQDMLFRFQKDTVLKRKEDQLTKLYEEYAALQDKEQKEQLLKKMDTVSENLFLLKKKWIGGFIQEHPSAVAGAFMLSGLFENSGYTIPVTEMDSIAGLFTGDALLSVYYQQMSKTVSTLKSLLPGNQAPDFTENDMSGNPVSLSSFRGKYVLLDFWASWCAPCRKENPGIVKVYNKYKNKPFTILGVSLDNNKQKLLDAIQKDQLAWNHVSSFKIWKSKAAELYHIRAIPANFLIDPSGKIIASDLHGEALGKKLEEVFGR